MLITNSWLPGKSKLISFFESSNWMIYLSDKKKTAITNQHKSVLVLHYNCGYVNFFFKYFSMKGSGDWSLPSCPLPYCPTGACFCWPQWPQTSADQISHRVPCFSCLFLQFSGIRHEVCPSQPKGMPAEINMDGNHELKQPSSNFSSNWHAYF